MPRTPRFQLLMLLLLALLPVASALCATPEACQLIAMVLFTFVLSVAQLGFLITLSIMIGISCCNRNADGGRCCGCQQGPLLVLGVLGFVFMAVQSWWANWCRDALDANSGYTYCSADALEELETRTDLGEVGEECTHVVYNYTVDPPTNYTLPGNTVTGSRWNDLWPWFAWNVVLAVADALLAAAALGWRHALTATDSRLKNRFEGLADRPGAAL